jgi:rhodanese-related sulfurtransferase
MKKDLLRAVAIVGAAFVIAVVANAVAGRERKLLLPGFYPDPFRIPSGQRRPVEGSVTSPAALTVTNVAPATTGTMQTATTPAMTAPATTTATTATTTATPTTIPAAVPPTSSAVPATSPIAAKPAPAPAAPAAATQPEANVLDRFPVHPDKAYVEISGADASWLHGRGALFLDARRTSVYEQGHIAGARSFSVWESDIDDKVNALFNERSSPEQQSQPIVVYCSGGACEDSHMLAEKLWGIQFNNVLVYKDGYPDWVKRGGSVRTKS